MPRQARLDALGTLHHVIVSRYRSRILSSCRYRCWLYGKSSLLIAVGKVVP